MLNADVWLIGKYDQKGIILQFYLLTVPSVSSHIWKEQALICCLAVLVVVGFSQVLGAVGFPLRLSKTDYWVLDDNFCDLEQGFQQRCQEYTLQVRNVKSGFEMSD